jgi:hypothetical protein
LKTYYKQINKMASTIAASSVVIAPRAAASFKPAGKTAAKASIVNNRVAAKTNAFQV